MDEIGIEIQKEVGLKHGSPSCMLKPILGAHVRVGRH